MYTYTIHIYIYIYICSLHRHHPRQLFQGAGLAHRLAVIMKYGTCCCCVLCVFSSMFLLCIFKLMKNGTWT